MKKKDVVSDNIYKVVFAVRAPSNESMRAVQIVDKKPKTVFVPKFYDWLPFSVCELSFQFKAELLYRAMDTYLKEVYANHPQSKITASISSDGYVFLYVYCWNDEKDKVLKASIEGNQSEWRDTPISAGKFIGIDGIGKIVSDGEPDILDTTSFDFYDLIRLYVKHSPNIGHFYLWKNKLLVKLKAGSDVKVYTESMQQKIDAYYDHQKEIHERRDEWREEAWEKKYQNMKQNIEARKRGETASIDLDTLRRNL